MRRNYQKSLLESIPANRMCGIILVAFVLLFYVEISEGAGLSTTFGAVSIENLQIGQTYSTRELVNLPLTVVNTSGESVNLQIDILYPSENELVEGYEPIPDISWIQLESDFFTISGGGSATTDVLITIPDDKRYLGKKFQVYLWSHTVGGKGIIALGLKSKLLFSISPKLEKISEKKPKEKPIRKLSFSVLPENIYVDGVEVGKKCSIKRLTGLTLKIINPNNKKYMYQLKSMATEDTLLKLKRGYEDIPDPSFLRFSKTKFKVSANGVKDIKMYLEFPDKGEYKGKRYMFVILAEVLGQEVGMKVFARLYVSTQK